MNHSNIDKNNEEKLSSTKTKNLDEQSMDKNSLASCSSVATDHTTEKKQNAETTQTSFQSKNDCFQPSFLREGSHMHDTTTPIVEQQEEKCHDSHIPIDHERQMILVLLLAQFCALHDPTPRTFTVHVIELFERGILGRQAIQFLHDTGFLPNRSSFSAMYSLPPKQTRLLLPALSADNVKSIPKSLSPANLSVVDRSRKDEHTACLPPIHIPRRISEASAIRSTLEQEEKQRIERLKQKVATAKKLLLSSSTTKQVDTFVAPPSKVSFSAEHHPLSLSRYQREFVQICLLSFGSFGHVFQVTSKTDSHDYAIKRIPFQSRGFSDNSVQEVMREVHCLALCNHAHVVRFYTSWLEPSWMTGGATSAPETLLSSSSASSSLSSLPSSTSSSMLEDFGRKNQIHVKNCKTKVISSTGESDNLTSGGFATQCSASVLLNDASACNLLIESGKENVEGDVDSEFFMRYTGSFDQQQYKTTFGADDGRMRRNLPNGSHFSDNISWATDGCNDEIIDDNPEPDHKNDCLKIARKPSQKRTSASYQYEICLFIQMQLCAPITLSDWIRQRNNSSFACTVASRMSDASLIFHQMASGLSHIHKNGIIHRDLKPGNVFRSRDENSSDPLHFMIGDFGLSKLMQQHQCSSANQTIDAMVHYRADAAANVSTSYPTSSATPEVIWQDPLTAGVGTASYAAPEQVASQTYCHNADIFSLGLILLELLCCFSTEHERIQTFRLCRQERILPAEIISFPNVANIILKCTDPNPRKRPTASELELTNISIFTEVIESGIADVSSQAQPFQSSIVTVEDLMSQLSDRDKQLQQYKDDNEKQQIYIKELERKVMILERRCSLADVKAYPFLLDEYDVAIGNEMLK